jgi:hypothetical protein
MTSQVNPATGLAAHETFHVDPNCVRYIIYSRELSPAPGVFHWQCDAQPTFPANSSSLFARDPSKPTLIVSPCQPIPNSLNAADRALPWVFDRTTGIWTRGSTTWGPAKHIMRVFNADTGQYVEQVGYKARVAPNKAPGDHFDAAVLELDLNDPKKVRNYNTWVSYTQYK